MFDFRRRILPAFLISWALCLGPVEATGPAETRELNLGTFSAGARFTTVIAAHNVSCKGKHDFEIVVRDTAWLTTAGSGTLTRIRKGSRKSTNLVVDLAGLAPGSHRGRVEVRCITCPPPPKCYQNLTSLDLVVNVREAVVAQDPATTPSDPAFKLERFQGGFIARYHSLGGEILTELHRVGEESVVRVDMPTLGNLVELTIAPPASSFSIVDEPDRASRLVLGTGFLSAGLEEQARILSLLSESTAAILPELVGEESEPVLHAIESIPYFVGLRLERGDVEKEEHIIMVGRNDGTCHGACGPGCDWCLCSTRWCACEVNLFCLAHDSCCGAWRDFFNCFPCRWDAW